MIFRLCEFFYALNCCISKINLYIWKYAFESIN